MSQQPESFQKKILKNHTRSDVHNQGGFKNQIYLCIQCIQKP